MSESNLERAFAPAALVISSSPAPVLTPAGWISRQSPRTLWLWALLAFTVVWMTLLACTSLTPPSDDIEQLTWVRSLEWGYYKHPPLPTWLIWLPVRLFGWSAATVYAMGALCTLVAMDLMWRLLAKLRGPGYATVAALAALCMTYYNARLYYYNHEMVLLVVSTACAALTWNAVATGRLRWWLALGVALGLGALAKYQIAITAVSIAAFVAHQRIWRDPRQRVGALLACLVALLIFAPHIVWLRTHDFGPVGYVVQSSLNARLGIGTRLVESGAWLGNQIFSRAMPALLLLLFLQRQGADRTTGGNDTKDSCSSLGKRDPATALILAWGVLPLLLMTSMGLFTGATLQLHWGTPFLLFLAPAAMELRRQVAWNRMDPTRLLVAFTVVNVILLIVSLLTSPKGPAALRDHQWQALDSMALAQQIAAPARRALGGPIRIVSGDAELAGSLALRLVEHPLVQIRGAALRNPWLAPDMVKRCGSLQIGKSDDLGPGATALGPEFAGLSWRVQPRQPTAPQCPTLSVH